MFASIAIIILALTIPTSLAVVVAWLLIRRGKVSAALAGGVSIVVAMLILALGVLNYDLVQCISRCQQAYGIDATACRFECSQQLVARPGDATVVAFIDVNLFLLGGLLLAGAYKQPVSWFNAFLLSSGAVILIASTTFFSNQLPIGIDQIDTNAQTYLSSLLIGLLGILLLFIAAHRMQRVRNVH